GELGNNTTTASATPVPVTGLGGAAAASAIAVGGEHACAVISGGQVVCWGSNRLGQLGVGSLTGPQSCGRTPCITTPVTVPGITNAVDVAAGDSHTCVLLSDDRVKCWGWNGHGQLGNGVFSNGSPFLSVPRPVWVTRKAIAAGGN